MKPQARISQVNRCLNCNNNISNNFCSFCGQKSNITKLNLFTIIKLSLKAITDLDNSLLRTFFDISTKPGRAISDYTAGQRVKYYNPIGFLIICLAISLFMSNLAQNLGLSEPNNITGELRDFLNSYPLIEMLFVLPIISLYLNILLSKSNKNYTEHLVFTIYTYAISSVLYSVLELTGAKLILPRSSLWLISLIFISWASIGFNQLKPITTFTKTFFAVLLGILTYAIPFALYEIFYVAS